MVYKIIVAGRLEFGREKTFKKVLEMYQFRVDNFYKFDLLFKEDVFNHELFHLNIPRLVTHSDAKSWTNTLKLLEYLAEFAIAGSMHLWRIYDVGEAKKVKHVFIEPKTDKAAVQNFIKGRDLVEESGKENEAILALNKAIEKYESHALAYERRGLVNFKFKNYKDALYDFTKSIDLNPHNTEPYYGRALVKLTLEDLQGAIIDLGNAVKHSIPLQPIHNKARKLKAETWAKLGHLEKAELDLKFLALRNYEDGDPFLPHLESTILTYGKLLLDLNKNLEAIPVFERAISLNNGVDPSHYAELLVHYGLALQKAGKKGFKKNWKSAAELGSKKAEDLLVTNK